MPAFVLNLHAFGYVFIDHRRNEPVNEGLVNYHRVTRSLGDDACRYSCGDVDAVWFRSERGDILRKHPLDRFVVSAECSVALVNRLGYQVSGTMKK